MQKQSIKTITLKRLIAASSLIVVALILLIAYNFKQLTFSAMLDKGKTVAQVVEVGLTFHMSDPSNKERFKNKIKAIPNITDLRIIRSEVVSQKMKLASHKELLAEPVINQVLNSKEQNFEFVSDDKNGLDMIRATIPFIAKTEKQCPICHQVEDGTVLGIVDFYFDVSQYKNQSLINIALILFVLSGILLIILFIIFRVIDQHIKSPLDMLMNETQNSYETHKPIKLEDFESIELEDVASQVNLFNQKVVRKNIELKKTNLQLLDLNENLENIVTQRTLELETAKDELQQLLSKLKSSIEYASIIQSS